MVMVMWMRVRADRYPVGRNTDPLPGREIPRLGRPVMAEEAGATDTHQGALWDVAGGVVWALKARV